MVFCKYTANAVCYNTVSEIPKNIWEELCCAENLYFNPTYLSALADNNSEIESNYLILNDTDGKAIAFATIHLVNFYLDSVKNGMQSTVEKLKCFGRKLGLFNTEKPFKMLLCGNPFVSGEHGIFIKKNQDKKKVIKELAQAVNAYVNSKHDLKNNVSAYILKDFVGESLEISNELHEYNFNSFKVEPNMILSVDPDWLSFDDYLLAMKTKFRVKAKKALKLSASLETVPISSENIEMYLPKMKSLYKAVSSSSGFNLGDFNLNTYKTLKENLGEAYFIQAYLLEGELVGFLSAMCTKNSLDAHFVGINYELNRKFAIYQRMLYDYITMAIDIKIKTINFGRTASEIKSSVGAVPQDLTVYVRHKKSIQNTFLKPFLNRIKPTPFRESRPFKEKTVVEK